MDGQLHQVHVSIGDFAEGKGVRPDGYLRLLMQLAEKQRKGTNYDAPVLITQHQASWIILSITITVHSQILPGEILEARICNVWRRGIIFRRDACFYRENGELVFVAASFYTLLDLKTRRICRDESLYEALAFSDGQEMMDASSRIPFSIDTNITGFRRQVRPSWLDHMGHMNNVRYGELIYDCLSTESRARIHTLARMELYFLNELRLGDAVLVNADNPLEISGVRESDHMPVFGARMVWETDGENV